MASHFNSDLVSKRALKYFEVNKNVLVIEDDTIMGQMVSEILSDVGFEVTAAPNGMIALEKLKQYPIDFIILDILLPEMSGFEIHEKLQANPDTKDIPVMIVTAWADSRHLEKASQVADSVRIIAGIGLKISHRLHPCLHYLGIVIHCFFEGYSAVSGREKAERWHYRDSVRHFQLDGIADSLFPFLV